MENINLEKFDPEAIAKEMDELWKCVGMRLMSQKREADRLLEAGELSKDERRKIMYEIERQVEDFRRARLDQALHFFGAKNYAEIVARGPGEYERISSAIPCL